MSKILALLAPGFEEIEFVAPVDIWRRAELEVVICGTTGNSLIPSSRDLKVQIDISLSSTSDLETLLEDVDWIFLPGGAPGYDNLRNNTQVLELLKLASQKDICIGAICAAPLVLKAAGLLNGQKVTSYPGVKEELTSGLECVYLEENIVESGLILTSRGPGTTVDFAFCILQKLIGEKRTQEIRSAMLF